MMKLIYPIVFISLLFWLFFGVGEEILFLKEGKYRILIFVIIIAGIPFFLYKTLLLFLDKKKAIRIAALSIFIFGPGFGFWSKYLSENDFKQYGKVTYGKVVNRKYRKGRWTIKAQFTYKSKKYLTFSENDNDNLFQLNDKVRIRFSTRNPENNDIIDL